MIVADTAVLACALVDNGADGALARRRLATASAVLVVEGVDLQVAALVARLVDTGRLTEQRAEQVMADLTELAVERVPVWPFLQSAWLLRETCGSRAADVAVARSFAATYVTADAPLAAQAAEHCRVELVSRPPG
jgi:predicted nucleic acid-binding protein